MLGVAFLASAHQLKEKRFLYLFVERIDVPKHTRHVHRNYNMPGGSWMRVAGGPLSVENVCLRFWLRQRASRQKEQRLEWRRTGDERREVRCMLALGSWAKACQKITCGGLRLRQ